MSDHTPELSTKKRCVRCNQEFPRTPDYFRRNKATPDGLQCYCKPCAKVLFSNPEQKAEYDRRYSAENRQRIAARRSEYYRRNKEALAIKRRERWKIKGEEYKQHQRERHAERYRSDPEYRAKYLAQKREWRAAHPEAQLIYYARNADTIRARARSWEIANRERKRAQRIVWYSRNIDTRRAKHRVNAAAYRARKSSAQGQHTREDIRRQYETQEGKCFYCGCGVGDTYHVDHVIPLSRGGSNGPENIVIACVTCNVSKGGRLPDEWRDRSS